MEKIKTEFERCLYLASYFALEAAEAAETLPLDIQHQERMYWHRIYQQIFQLHMPFIKPKKKVKRATGYSSAHSLIFTGGLVGDIKGEPKIDTRAASDPEEENGTPPGGVEAICDGGSTDGQAEPRGAAAAGPGGGEGGGATEAGGCGGGGAVE